MPHTKVSEVVVPAASGRTITVQNGQQLRIVAVDGPQAADIVALNAADHRESLSVWLTRHMSGSFCRASSFYTRLPAGQIMFDLDEAPPGCLWLSPGRCNRLKYEKQGRSQHANCQDILTATLQPYGISGFDVPDVLNLFMNPKFNTDGTYRFEASPVQPGDYVALTARMDALVAVSACPDDAEYNAGYPKPLVLEIWE